MSQDFSIDLPSNTSKDVFPNNQMHDYTTRLIKRLDLKGYSVALTELHFPTTWYDVLEDTYLTVGRSNTNQERLTIPPGKYRTMENLISFINNITLRDVSDVYSVQYDNIRSRVAFSIFKPGYSIELSDRLSILLGYESKRSFVSDDPIVSDFVSDTLADIDSGMTGLYIYTNIVQNSLVGDTQVPILRIVPILKEEGANYQFIQFPKPTYVPTTQETTDLITINIRRDTGEFVPFKLGKVVVKLHFKKTS